MAQAGQWPAMASNLAPLVIPSTLPGVTSAFGVQLDMETTQQLLSFLQVRTLCRMRIVSSQCSSMVSSKAKAMIAHFCYTTDELESTVFSKRGRRKPQPEEARNRLLRFFTQPEHGPMFRHLDLRNVPVNILQREELHDAVKHMTRLSHVVYPTCGWPERGLLFTFLAAFPAQVTKEAADGTMLR